MSELQTIGISALFDGESAAIAAVDRAIARAIETEGGFGIAEFPGAEDLDRRSRALLRFFDLTEDEKRQVATQAIEPAGQRIYRGYVCSFDPQNWAHNEFFDIGPDDPVGGPAVPGMEIFAETNIWPEREPVPGWRALMRRHHRDLQRVSLAVMFSAGRAFGFEEAAFKARFLGGNSTLRLLNYPRPPRSVQEKERALEMRLDEAGEMLAAGRHCDASGLSLLWQDRPGLQAEAPDGTWRDIPSTPNSISVHLGDVLSIMTEGSIQATPHRVVDHGETRQSVGFFLEPALSARLAPLRTSDQPEGHPSAGTYGWHLMNTFHQRDRHKALVPAPP
ncbi:MAG: 2OG-Fe(II) oxygenase family protein [Kiloniellales bacterium]